jgi:hypothetical protein
MLTRAVVKPVSPAIVQEEKKKGQGHKDRCPLIPNPLPLFLYPYHPVHRERKLTTSYRRQLAPIRTWRA